MKKIHFILIIVAIFTTHLIAQTAADLDVIARIRAEGFQSSQVMDIASQMTDIYGNRLTGSRGIKRAQQWAKETLEAFGLENVIIEPILDHGVSWDNEYTSLHMLTPDYYPLQGFPLAYTAGKITQEAVIAEINGKTDFETYRGTLKDKIVLISPMVVIDPEAPVVARRRSDEEIKSQAGPGFSKPGARPPRVENPNQISDVERLEFLKAEGACLVIECRSGRIAAVRTFARPGSYQENWSAQGMKNSLPMITLVPEQYNRIYRLIKRGIPVTMEAEIRNRIGEKTRVQNVIAEIPGTDLKDEVVMLGGHFDSWHTSPGATDNASGCSVMMEAVRILKATGVRPRRTIRIALWSSEEDGIRGSGSYVKKYFGIPETGTTPAYDKFSVYYNMDYGARQFKGIYMQGNEFVRQIFTRWTALFNDLGMHTVSIRSVGSTDHIPFDRAGLPAFQFMQDRAGQGTGHTNLDFYDNLIEEDLMKNSVIMASFVYLSAMMDERMPRKAQK